MAPPLSPHPSVVARRLDDQMVLVNLDTNRMFTLNSTGSVIWELLAAGKSPGTIVAELVAQHDAEETAVSKELNDLIGELKKESLIVEAGNG